MGQVEIEAISGGGAGETIDVSGEYPVPVPIEAFAATPGQVELAVVGLHDRVEQDGCRRLPHFWQAFIFSRARDRAVTSD